MPRISDHQIIELVESRSHEVAGKVEIEQDFGKDQLLLHYPPLFPPVSPSFSIKFLYYIKKTVIGSQAFNAADLKCKPNTRCRSDLKIGADDELSFA